MDVFIGSYNTNELLTLFDESALKILFRNIGISCRFHAVAKSIDVSWIEIILTAVA